MLVFIKIDSFLQVLNSRLNPGGVVISFDPLQTAWSVWLARTLYRPFQQDAAWEWPFKRKNFKLIEDHFQIEELQGVLGHAKWSFALSMIPFLGRLAVRWGRKLHERDLKKASRTGRGLWRCMQVALKLRKTDGSLELDTDNS